jgi:glutamate---cysteine ligase / carboxylate-amine ligase
VRERTHPSGALPEWARWNEAAAQRPWTVGIEEELVLLDARGRVANRGHEIVAHAGPPLSTHFSGETHACVVELRTGVHRAIPTAVAELGELRRALADFAGRLGLRVAAAGTHPLASRSQVAVSPGQRYQDIAAATGALARREPTMALHVHVGVPDAEAAIHALDGLRMDLPVLLALSANSPFWRCVDSGFASIRTPIFSMFPRVGIPRSFGAYREFVRGVDPLLRSGAVTDVGHLWWDARVRPSLGTVEVRIMDAQTRLADTAGLAALVQCLVRRHADGDARDSAGPEVLEENRFLAARDGMGAQLIEPASGRRCSARELVSRLIVECEWMATQLGCPHELWAGACLAHDPGCVRQRRHAASAGVADLPEWLTEQFLAGTETAVERGTGRFGPAQRRAAMTVGAED